MARQKEGKGISWTNETWNPLRGCSMVSRGCERCYAMRVAARFSGEGQPYEGLAVMGNNGPRWTGKVQLVEKHLHDPLKWKKPKMIFVNSMSDLFHESVADEWIDKIFAVMALSPQHTFQVLTKRPERMLAYFQRIREISPPYWTREFGVLGHALLNPWDIESEPLWFKTAFEKMRAHHYPDLPVIPRTLGEAAMACPWPLPNVWLGVSCEDQQTANERIPLLLQTPAAVRWVSAEPLLGPIDLSAWLQSPYPQPATYGDGYYSPWGEGMAIRNAQWKPGLHWLVVGGESGHGARPMHPDWARDLRNQCRAAEVPFFFKQWGGWAPTTADKIRGKHTDNGLYVLPNGRYGNQGDWWDGRAECMEKVGKHAAGRLLDGQEHSEYPHIPEPA